MVARAGVGCGQELSSLWGSRQTLTIGRERCLGSGMYDYETKPFDVKAFQGGSRQTLTNVRERCLGCGIDA